MTEITHTTFGTIERDERGTRIYGAGIVGPENQLRGWANYYGASWPCSVLADLDDIAVSFDLRGDLVDISGDTDEISNDELNAWASDCLYSEKV